MTNHPVIELVVFRLRDGVDEQAFLRAADALMPDLEALGGYISRRLLKAEDGHWVDILSWTSLDAAKRAAEAILAVPSCAPFLGMIDETDVTFLHLTHQRVYAGVRTG